MAGLHIHSLHAYTHMENCLLRGKYSSYIYNIHVYLHSWKLHSSCMHGADVLLFSWIYTKITSFSGDDGADLDLLLGIDKNVQQRSSALFLLKLKEHRRISQVAIVEDWDGLFSHSVQRLHARKSPRKAGFCCMASKSVP